MGARLSLPAQLRTYISPTLPLYASYRAKAIAERHWLIPTATLGLITLLLVAAASTKVTLLPMVLLVWLLGLRFRDRPLGLSQQEFGGTRGVIFFLTESIQEPLNQKSKQVQFGANEMEISVQRQFLRKNTLERDQS